MWCGKCQSEVAAEVSSDNQRVFCAACGTLLSTIDAPPSRPTTDKFSDRTKDARELLQRWSSGKVVDPFGPPILASSSNAKTPPNPLQDAKPATPSTALDLSDTITRTAASFENTAPRPATPLASIPPFSDSLPPTNTTPASTIKLPDTLDTLTDRPAVPTPNLLAAVTDSAQTTVTPSSSPFVSSVASPTPFAAALTNPPVSAVPRSHFHRIDAAHPAVQFASGTKATTGVIPDSVGPFASKATSQTSPEIKRLKMWFPTWDPAVWRSEPSGAGGWSSLAGQFLAYAGVLGMTAGACMAVWSYFGGPASYAPTGWLLATAGQMLLFFGVVTLVSGGLEQTTEQVNKRIEQLGDHIIRIEQAAREMSVRGGAVPPAHFGNDHEAAASQRSAASGYERSIVEE